MGSLGVSPPNTISDAELQVMKTLWELRRATVREIRRHLEGSGRTWAHTTVNTLLSRMEQKGLVVRDPSGFAHIYAPAASREALVRQRLGIRLSVQAGCREAVLRLEGRCRAA